MLKKNIQQDKPSILMLQETKPNSTTLNSLIHRLWKGSQCIFVDSIGASGGLTIVWNPLEVEMDNFLATRCSITASLHILGTVVHGRITNVYGPQLPTQKTTFLVFLQWLVNEQPTDIDIGRGFQPHHLPLRQERGTLYSLSRG